MADGAFRVLDRRALSRATLARQLLLERVPLCPSRGRRAAGSACTRRSRTTRTPAYGSVLHDGFLAAAWGIERDRAGGTATLVVRHPGRLANRPDSSIAVEGRRLLRLTDPQAATREVRFQAL